MLRTIEGIITKTVKYGESSIILDILTPENGIKSFIISGVRSKGKKNKASLVSVLNIVKVEAYVKDNDTLSRIKEINYSYIYRSIPFNIVKSSIATLLIEVCRKASKASDDSHGIYNYIVKGLIHLDNTEGSVAHFHIIFLIGLAKYLGFEITDNYNSVDQYFDLRFGSFKNTREDHRLSLDEENSRCLHAYLSKEKYLDVPRKSRLSILLSLADYYRYHIEDFGELKSLDILMDLYQS